MRGQLRKFCYGNKVKVNCMAYEIYTVMTAAVGTGTRSLSSSVTTMIFSMQIVTQYLTPEGRDERWIARGFCSRLHGWLTSRLTCGLNGWFPYKRDNFENEQVCCVRVC